MTPTTLILLTLEGESIKQEHVYHTFGSWQPLLRSPKKWGRGGNRMSRRGEKERQEERKEGREERKGDREGGREGKGGKRRGRKMRKNSGDSEET